MPSAVATAKLSSELNVRTWDHDPGGTTAILAGPDGGTTKRYVDMSDAGELLCVASPSVGGSITKLELVASATTAFSSVVVVKDSGTVAADALDDQVVLECTAEELTNLGTSLRYVAARVTMGTGTDEAKVMYITKPRHSYADRTATVIT